MSVIVAPTPGGRSVRELPPDLRAQGENFLRDRLEVCAAAGFPIGRSSLPDHSMFAVAHWCEWCSDNGRPALEPAATDLLDYQLSRRMAAGERETFYHAIAVAHQRAGKESPVPHRVQTGSGFADASVSDWEDSQRVRLGLPKKADAAQHDRLAALQAENAALRARVAELEAERTPAEVAA